MHRTADESHEGPTSRPEDLTEKEEATGLEPPRFGLRVIFAIVSFFAVSIVVWRAVGPVIGTTILFALLIVAGHVAGNAIGTRLRSLGTRNRQRARFRAASLEGDVEGRSGRSGNVQPHQFAPVTRLSRRSSLGRFPIVVAILGAVGGAVGGCLGLRRLYPDAAADATLVLGTLATGVLGAFFAYWVYSLLQVFFGAWWQAHRHGQER